MQLSRASLIQTRSLGLIFGITIPFVGVLVRYRANYTPKAGAVRLDGEDGLAAAPSSDSISYFGMMKRVYRIEGWAGLYKGIMPSIIASLIAIVMLVPVSVVLASGHRTMPHGRVYLPAQSVMWSITFALSTIPVLLLVPLTIITNRAFTTPHKLAAFAPKAALRVLLSPAERAQPLRLYLAPGVALALVLEAFVTPVLSLLRYVAEPHLAPIPALAVGLPVLALATVLVTPLEVMVARLTLQRRGLDFEIEPTPDTEAVMDFRTQAPPYTSLLDCGRTMVAEEGWRVLFRAWWLTALVMLVPLLTPTMAPPPA
ncbi:hypothetical protein C8R44DRAFT_677361 [Mycena epipterygia]|nr:hypothetical protein C8R44DRAFT_677361 [Mycena epipterygia]